MATWTPPFELRRVLVRISRTPAGGTVEDKDVFTYHLLKLTGGAPDANWITADYTAAETRLDTAWTTLKTLYPPRTTLAEYRWYKDGQVWAPDDLAPGPSNPAERVTARAVAGTASDAGQLPPQCAISVTKIVPIRKRWGRSFLPAPASGFATVDGRLTSAAANSVRNVFVALMNGHRTDGFKPVVWSRGRSAYVTPRGTSVPAHTASAYEITDVQVDDLFDVIRSRRYTAPTLRDRTALT